MRLPILSALFAVLAALAVTGLAAAPAAAEEASGIGIVNPWARATPGASKIGALYLEIQAAESAGDRLTGASSPAAAVTEIHTHVEEAGVMKMRRLDAVDVPAGETRVFKPGGLHLMLIDLIAPLKEGEEISVKLTFEKAGVIEIEAPVLAQGAMGPADTAGGASSGADATSADENGSHAGSGSDPGSADGN